MYRTKVVLLNGVIHYIECQSWGEAEVMADLALGGEFWPNVSNAYTETYCHKHGWAPSSADSCDLCAELFLTAQIDAYYLEHDN